MNDKFPDVATLARAPHLRELSQAVDLMEKLVNEGDSALRVVLRNVVADGVEGTKRMPCPFNPNSPTSS